jgi:hypothetical protein
MFIVVSSSGKKSYWVLVRVNKGGDRDDTIPNSIIPLCVEERHPKKTISKS